VETTVLALAVVEMALHRPVTILRMIPVVAEPVMGDQAGVVAALQEVAVDLPTVTPPLSTFAKGLEVVAQTAVVPAGVVAALLFWTGRR
jgi:hypothetical protein